MKHHRSCTVFTLITLALFFTVFAKLVLAAPRHSASSKPLPFVVEKEGKGEIVEEKEQPLISAKEVADADKVAKVEELVARIMDAQTKLKALEKQEEDEEGNISKSSSSESESSESSSSSNESKESSESGSSSSSSSSSSESSEENQKDSDSSEREPFTYDISASAYEDYQDLIRYGRMIFSKDELRQRRLKWAKDNGVLDEYVREMTAFETLCIKYSKTLLNNLAGEARALYKQILSIENDDSLTQKEECLAFGVVLTSANPLIRSLIPLDPIYTSMKKCMEPRWDITPPVGYQLGIVEDVEVTPLQAVVAVSVDCSCGGCGLYPPPPPPPMMMDNNNSNFVRSLPWGRFDFMKGKRNS